ncbi:MAG: rhomboid family intramembrane serine protease [Chitinophagaceae bacterium]
MIWIIIVITVLFSLYGFQGNNTRLWLNTQSIRKGQYYRFLTAGFVHADWIHLLFNMFTLYAFSSSWESIYIGYLHYDPSLFLLFYIGGIGMGNVVTWWIYRRNENDNSLGASAGVIAVLFSTLMFEPWERIYVFIIPMPVILFIALFIGYSIYGVKKNSDYINHWAHLAGMVWGLIVTFFCYPNIFQIFYRTLLH